jgi:hypothetical protein
VIAEVGAILAAHPDSVRPLEPRRAQPSLELPAARPPLHLVVRLIALSGPDDEVVDRPHFARVPTGYHGRPRVPLWVPNEPDSASESHIWPHQPPRTRAK